MSRRLPWCSIAITLALLILPASMSAVAGERAHAVQPGESVSSIARDNYGDFELVELLLRYNGRSDAAIYPGEHLAIPVSEVHEVRPGDTWSELAKRYLGEPSAYPVVAMLNGMPPDAPLTVGASIVMPAILDHRLERGETLAGLAELYYADATASELLERFNAIDDPRRLSTGQTVRIPLLSFRTIERTPAAAPIKTAARKKVSSEPQPEELEPRRRFTAELAAASTAFAEGEYAQARERLESLREAVNAKGTRDDRSELARLLAFVYVAFDLPDEACRAFARVGRSNDGNDGKASDELDPDLVSPKIRRALSSCDQRSPAPSS